MPLSNHFKSSATHCIVVPEPPPSHGLIFEDSVYELLTDLNDFLVDVPYTMSGNKEFEERKRNFYMDGRITGNYISSTDPEAMPNIKIYDNLGDVTLHMTFLLNNGTVQITNRFMVRTKAYYQASFSRNSFP